MFLGASLIQYHTEQSEHVRGQEITGPIMTIDAANRYGLTAASLVKYYGNDRHGQNIQDPLHTVISKDHEGLTTAHLVKMKGTNLGGPATEPVQTITAGGGHHGAEPAEHEPGRTRTGGRGRSYGGHYAGLYSNRLCGGVCRGSMPVYPYAWRWPEMSEQKRPEICEYCALGDHDAYICARWRLSYAVNELKKAVPLLRRTAEKQMKCPYYYPAGLLKTGLVIMDEIGPWPPERKGS